MSFMTLTLAVFLFWSLELGHKMGSFLPILLFLVLGDFDICNKLEDPSHFIP
jgi:hypothetical protein